MFKTMGYSPGFFPQNRPISDPREFTRNRQKQSPNELEIHFQAHRNRFRKFGTISRTFQNRPCSKPWAIAQAFCSKWADFRPSRIHPKSTKTVPNELEIHLQAHRNRFRKFGTISRTFQNRPCSKPWAIAQAFCSKWADFRPSRIHPKSTKTVPERVRNPFSSAQESF